MKEINEILNIEVYSEIRSETISKILSIKEIINLSKETGESVHTYYTNKLL